MKRRVNLLSMLAGIVVVALPIFAALQLSWRLSLDEEGAQLHRLSREVLRRAEETADQSNAAVLRLSATKDPDHCSDSNIALMRELDVGSSYIQALGAVTGDELTCSSLGRHVPPLPIGPAAYRNALGTSVRPSVELSATPGTPMAIFERGGYAVIIHKNLAIDVYTDRIGNSLGIFAISSKAPIMGRGEFDAGWPGALAGREELVGLVGDDLVSISPSKRYDYAGYAAMPVVMVRAEARKLAMSLVPIGALVGILALVPLVILARRQASLRGLIRAGLKRDEFLLHYQPILDLATGRCVGAEALIRWKRKDGTMVRPDLFIPVAEEFGLIRSITRRVIELLRRDAGAILAVHPEFEFSINLSAEDLHSERVVGELRHLLGANGMQSANLHVEMTERGMVNADLTRSRVQEIRELGIEVAIDDFGTGFCSLSYLTTFAVDYLKIDKSFVDTLGTTLATSQVAMHIIEMAKELDLKMIAEGIETEAQATILREAGVQFGQGWLFAKAMAPGELLAYLRQR